MRDTDRDFIKRAIDLGWLNTEQGAELQLAVAIKRRQGATQSIAELAPELTALSAEQIRQLSPPAASKTRTSPTANAPAAASGQSPAAVLPGMARPSAADIDGDDSIIDLDLLETDDERHHRIVRQSDASISVSEIQRRLAAAEKQATTVTDIDEHDTVVGPSRESRATHDLLPTDDPAITVRGDATAIDGRSHAAFAGPSSADASGDASHDSMDDGHASGDDTRGEGRGESSSIHMGVGVETSQPGHSRGATSIRRARYEGAEIAVTCPRCHTNFTVDMPVRVPGVDTTGPEGERRESGDVHGAPCPACGYLTNLREVEDSADFDRPPAISAVTTATAAESLTDPYVGRLIGRCQIKRKLGQGGMGTVYLGTHEVLDKDRAVKILPANFARDKATADRFIQEARTAAKLEHKNILQVYDVGQQDDVYFIVMQFADGGSLSRVLRKHGRLRFSYALRLIEQIADGLSAAHKMSIVHRDIKPDNIMMLTDGTVKIGDFGLAKSTGMGADITSRGLIVGSPAYMSPEQCDGKAVDARSDIYSLGITFYHMVCGRRPFQGATPLAMMLMHQTEIPKPPADVEPEVPGYVSNLILRMIQKHPEDRFQSMDELLVAVQEAIRRHELEKSLHAGITRSVDERLFGLIAIRELLVTREQMAAVLHKQNEERELYGEPPTLGLIARRLGFLSLEGEQRIKSLVANARAQGAEPPVGLLDNLVTEGGEIPASAFTGRRASDQDPESTARLEIGRVLDELPQSADDFTPVVLSDAQLEDARIEFEVLKAELREIYKHDDEPKKALDKIRPFLDRFARTVFGNEVREFFDTLIQKVADAYDRLGLKRMEKNDLDEAIRKFDEALKINPELAVAYNNRGIAQMRRGNLSAAFRDFMQAIQLDAQAMFYYNRGQVLRKLDKLAEAEESYNRCLDLDPSHDKAWCNRGGVRFTRKDYAGALADFEQALAVNPTNIEALSGRAKIFRRQGDADRALAEFRRLVDVQPNSSKAHCALGEVLLEFGHIDEAKRHLKTAVKLDSAQPDPLYHLAVIAAREGDAEKSLALLRKSLKKGFRRFKKIKAEPAFSLLESNADYQHLLKGMRHR